MSFLTRFEKKGSALNGVSSDSRVEVVSRATRVSDPTTSFTRSMCCDSSSDRLSGLNACEKALLPAPATTTAPKPASANLGRQPHLPPCGPDSPQDPAAKLVNPGP